jgi:hypothetical protein
MNKKNRNDALWVITSYFNWCRYDSKWHNYLEFRRRMEADGVNLLTVECAMTGSEFQLPRDPSVIQVRASSVLWQKERLLNIGLENLPASARFVAWVDCDLIFSNQKWQQQTVATLERFGVVELYENMIRLPAGRMRPLPEDKPSNSFMAGMRAAAIGAVKPRLGHPGFAWAARRDVLEACGGFYDGCIVGGADRVMAHAWFGDFHNNIVEKSLLARLNPITLSGRDWRTAS